jgi:flagella basal body P-ring formation protein FlgA
LPGKRWLLAGLLALVTPAFAASAADAPVASAVSAAIERAVRDRVGESATIAVTDVSGVRLGAALGTLLALPEPAARAGGRMRFRLSAARPGSAPVRIGEAMAAISVSVPAVKVVRAIERGERLTEADVTAAQVNLDGRPLRPLPQTHEAIGARATRELSAQSVLVRGDLAPEPIVRAGDLVRTHARVGEVEVVAVMVAGESGNADEIIRVVNQETKRALRARVLSRGEVEVVNVR